jgi:hypothetical protein
MAYGAEAHSHIAPSKLASQELLAESTSSPTSKRVGETKEKGYSS